MLCDAIHPLIIIKTCVSLTAVQSLVRFTCASTLWRAELLEIVQCLEEWDLLVTRLRLRSESPTHYSRYSITWSASCPTFHKVTSSRRPHCTTSRVFELWGIPEASGWLRWNSWHSRAAPLMTSHRSSHIDSSKGCPCHLTRYCNSFTRLLESKIFSTSWVVLSWLGAMSVNEVSCCWGNTGWW